MLPQSQSLRVIYFSSQPAAITNAVAGLLEQAGLKVLLVVTTPGPAARRTEAYKDVVAHHTPGFDVLVTSHMGRLAGMLGSLEPDLIFVTGFPWKLPAEVLSLPRLGSINTHPALLPAYRGPDPLFWQIMNGETRTGLTVHRMDTEFDTGPILAQESMPIGPDDDIDIITERILPLGVSLLPRAIGAVLAGEPGTPQPEEGASYAPLRSEQDRELDWSRAAQQLRNQVRAWGHEGAIGHINGQAWLVRRAHLADAGSGNEAPPGSVVILAPGSTAVQTGDGLLVLEDAVPLAGE